MTEQFQMIAKTFKGLERVLANELEQLGATKIEIGRRAVSFEGDTRMMYKANLWLRTASRVLVPLATFSAKDADEVYEKVKQIEWTQYMSLKQTFSIDSTVFSETFPHSQYLTYRVKDGIADYFNDRFGKRPSVQLTDPDIYINVHVAANSVTISLDSSGQSLHKRGWRKEQTIAPINEALAAGMLLLSGWEGQTDFMDPMCGSGTILIEAAMIALNIPPGIYREHFAFERWQDFQKDLFEELYNDDSEEREFKYHIYGSDTSFYALRVAEKNIRSAGLQKYISIRQCPVETLQNTDKKKYLIVTNPPYGERINGHDTNKLYESIGTTLKHQFTGSEAWIISSNEEALNHIGLKYTDKHKLLNGDLDCLLLKYEMFDGKHKDFKRQQQSQKQQPSQDNKTRRPLHSNNNKRPTRDDKRTAHTDSRIRLSSSRRENSKVSGKSKR